MADDQRHGQQQFVFQQFKGIEFAGHRQQILFAVIVFGQGSGLIGNKTEPAVDLHRYRHSFQATLTGLRQRQCGLQMHPVLQTRALAPDLTVKRPIA